MDVKFDQGRPAWQRIIGRATRIFGAQYYDMLQGHRNLQEPIVSTPNGGTWQARIATVEDLEKITKPNEVDSLARFKCYFQLGSTCHVAYHDKKILGSLWVNRESMEFLGVPISTLQHEQCFVHSVLVDPDARRQGVFRFLFRYLCNELRDDGYQSIGCLVDRANFASVQAFSSEGMRFESAPIIKLPGAKYIHLFRARK